MREKYIFRNALIFFVIGLLVTVLIVPIISSSTNTCKRINGRSHPLELWHQLYDGGDTDEAWGVATDSNNNVFVTGRKVIPDGSFSNDNYFTIKYRSNGNWERAVMYDGGNYDQAFDVTVDSNDNFIVTGRSKLYTKYEIHTIKYDNNANELWSKTFDSGDEDTGKGIAVDSHDNVIVTGHSTYANRDYNTIKYDSGGNFLWNKIYDGGDRDWGMSVAIDSMDNIIVTGASRSTSTSYFDFYTIKYASTGQTLWTVSYDRACKEDWAYDVTVDSQDNIIVVGNSASLIDDEGDYCTIKYDTDGNTLWERFYDGGLTDRATSVSVYSFDNIVVSGYTTNGVDHDYYTIAYDMNGNFLGDITYDSGSYDYCNANAVDSNNDVIVTGWSQGITYNYLTIKYGYSELNLCSPTGNRKPRLPSITGPLNGKAGEFYDYSIQASDPDGDDMTYHVEWGDGNIDEGLIHSHGEAVLTHSWTDQGSYTVRVKVIDIYEAESDWAELSVSMPRNRAINTLFFNFLQNYPILYQFLQRFLQL